MREIIGNTTATPTPQADWNQKNATKADYIKNKPNVPYLDANDNDYIIVDVELKKDELKKYIDEELQNAKDGGEFSGKSAYAYAQDGGYTGSEEDFANALAKIASATYAEEASF